MAAAGRLALRTAAFVRFTKSAPQFVFLGRSDATVPSIVGMVFWIEQKNHHDHLLHVFSQWPARP